MRHLSEIDGLSIFVAVREVGFGFPELSRGFLEAHGVVFSAEAEFLEEISDTVYNALQGDILSDCLDSPADVAINDGEAQFEREQIGEIHGHFDAESTRVADDVEFKRLRQRYFDGGH